MPKVLSKLSEIYLCGSFDTENHDLISKVAHTNDRKPDKIICSSLSALCPELPVQKYAKKLQKVAKMTTKRQKYQMFDSA